MVCSQLGEAMSEDLNQRQTSPMPNFLLFLNQCPPLPHGKNILLTKRSVRAVSSKPSPTKGCRSSRVPASAPKSGIPRARESSTLLTHRLQSTKKYVCRELPQEVQDSRRVLRFPSAGCPRQSKRRCDPPYYVTAQNPQINPIFWHCT